MVEYLYAGSSDSGKIFSFNGTTWNLATDTNIEYVYDLASFNNSLFAGAGTNATIITLNGTTWDSNTISGNQNVFSLTTFNNSLFAGTGGNGKVYVSSNGVTWDLSTTFSNGPAIYDLTVGNNSLFAATGYYGDIYTFDGTTWDLSTNISTQCSLFAIYTYNNSIFAGGEISGNIYVYNGTTWNTATNLNNQVVSFIEYNSSLFIGTADSGGKIYTFNGTTWDLSSQLGTSNSVYSLGIYNNSLFAGLNIENPGDNNAKIYTFNGTTWDLSTTTTECQIKSLLSYNTSTSSINSPTITTQAVTGISYTTATGNGNITSTGGENPSLRGFAYNTSSNPTIINDVKSESGSFGTGAFNLSLTSLNPSTNYYIRAFASNSAGLAYGNETNFTTSIAGKTLIYNTQKVAQQFSFPKTASLNRVNLSLSRNVSSAPVTSNILIQIQENDTVNNIPNGSIVTTAVDNFTDSGYKNFYFTDRPLIRGNDKYWIVASATNANYENAYNWASSANTDATRYRAIGNTWASSTTAAQNFSAFVPHDRFNYQQYQGTQTVVENFSGGNDFYVVDKQTDMERIFNDITMVGRGDGINQVSARSLDSASINTYGRRQQKIEDKSLTTASDCQCVADTLISKYKDPVTVFDLDMTDPNIEADVGDKVAIFSDIRNINSESYRIISTEDYADMFEDGIKFNLNNAKTSIITDIDKIKKDKDLQNTYGQGATNLFQLSEEDNCDDSNGLKVLFYIPDEAKSINSVKMRWSRKPFRGYSLATKGGGGITETTTNEGSFSQTSAGDISPITINSFSRAIENQGATAAPISAIIAAEPPQNFYPGTGTTFGYTQMSGFFTNQTGYQRCVCAQLCVYCRPTSSFVAYLGNYGAILNNKQTMYYNVYTNTQYNENNDWLTSYHNVAAHGVAPSDIVGINVQSALNHTHIVTVSGHTHQVTLPDHTHQIDYGIYTPGSEDVVQIDLYVDTTGGTPTHTFTGVTVNTSYPADIELSPYITTTGWHYIYLKPTFESGAAGTNSDARLQANAYVQIYIESK